MDIQRHITAATSASARRVLARTIRSASRARLGAVVGEGLWLCTAAQGETGAEPLVGASGQTLAVRALADADAVINADGALLARACDAATLASAIADLRARHPGATIIGIVPDARALDTIEPLRAGADDVFGTGMMTAEAMARIEAISRRRALAQAQVAPRPAQADATSNWRDWTPKLVG